jgi:CBS domain-containing protein
LQRTSCGAANDLRLSCGIRGAAVRQESMARTVLAPGGMITSSRGTPGALPIAVARLPVRTRRVIGSHGEDLVGASVYCPVREAAVEVSVCERCEHFHALHFDAESRTTSVACHCEATSPGPIEEGFLRDALGGLPDPATPLAEIMSNTVVCVRPDTSLDEVATLLVRHAIGGVPVVDEHGRPVGIVSQVDILRTREEDGGTQAMRKVTARPRRRDPDDLEPGSHVLEPEPLTARDVMSAVVLALHETASIGQAAALMAFEGVHRLPIVSDTGQVVGILTALDVLGWLGRRSGYLVPQNRKRE